MVCHGSGMLLIVWVVGEVGVSPRTLVLAVSLILSERVRKLCSAVGELHPRKKFVQVDLRFIQVGHADVSLAVVLMILGVDSVTIYFTDGAVI